MPVRVPLSNEINADFRAPRRLSAGGLRVNYSGLQSATAEVGRNLANGPRYKEVDYTPLRAVGEALGAVGEAVKKRNEKAQEVQDKRKLYQAETMQLVGQEELQRRLAEEKDPTKWSAIAEQHVEEMEFNTDGMSPEAIDALELHRQRSAQMTVSRTRAMADQQNEKLLIGEAQNLVDLGVKNRDPATVVNAAIGLTGILPDHEVQKIIMDGSDAIQKSRLQEVDMQVRTALADSKPEDAARLVAEHPDLQLPMFSSLRESYEVMIGHKHEGLMMDGMMVKDPMGYYQQLQDPKAFTTLNEIERQGYTERAVNYIRQKNGEATEQAFNAIADGILTTPSQLDTPTWKNLTPAKREEIKKVMVKGKPNDPAEFIGMADIIQQTERTQDDTQNALTFAELRSQVALKFSGHHRDALLELVDTKESGGPAEEYSVVTSRITQAFKDGYLGNYKVPFVKGRDPGFFLGAKAGTPITPEDQARTSKEVPEAQRLEEGELVVDVQLRTKAEAQLRQLLDESKRMQLAGKTPQEVEKWADDQLRTIRLAAPIQSASPGLMPTELSEQAYQDAINALGTLPP